MTADAAEEIAVAAQEFGAELKKFVRITGIRLDRYVEFEFSVNDADLTIELILPFAAFDEFCTAQQAVVLHPEPATATDLERLAWRSRQPGLLQRGASRTSST